MQDRVPVNPGRVLIAPENGAAPYYATMTRADNPTQEGTALNKANLLKDATAAKFGLGADAVPDDVFFKLTNVLFNSNGIPTDIDGNVVGVQIATGSYTGTGTYTSAGAVSIPVGFAPKIVFVYNTDFKAGNTDVLQLVMMGEMYSIVGYKNSISITSGTGNNANTGTITEWGDTVSFWANSGTYFPNKSGLIYKWFAIG